MLLAGTRKSNTKVKVMARPSALRSGCGLVAAGVPRPSDPPLPPSMVEGGAQSNRCSIGSAWTSSQLLSTASAASGFWPPGTGVQLDDVSVTSALLTDTRLPLSGT